MIKLRPDVSRHGLKQIIDNLLDKGVVVNARIRTYLEDFKLIDLDCHAVLASFETAAKHNLALPKSIDLSAIGWREIILKEKCPQCAKKLYLEELFQGCPWCGYELGGGN